MFTPVEVDKDGYGTWRCGNRRVFISPVYRVGAHRIGYRAKLPGPFWNHVGRYNGYRTLAGCQKAAALAIEAKYSEKIS